MDIKEIEYFSQALDQANTLKTLLEDEFNALRIQDLTQFEALQPLKIKILSFLASDGLANRVKGFDSDTADLSLIHI